MKNRLSMRVMPAQGDSFEVNLEVGKIACSRSAGRDTAAIQVGLNEARKQGYAVHGPAGICYRSTYLLTNENGIQVQGPQTSGEVEFVAFAHSQNIYISVGSDHNDRSLLELWTSSLGRVYDTAKAKQMVPAVVAPVAWPYDDVRDHWDELILSSSVTVDGKAVPYQEYRLADMLDLEYYLSTQAWKGQDGEVLLGGSSGMLPTIPENIYQGQDSFENVIFPSDFCFAMHDPLLERSISHRYTIAALEEPGSLSL